MPQEGPAASADANEDMIPALLSSQEMGHLEGLGTALFVLLIISALVECFLGYVLFRLVLVVVALMGGTLFGAAVVSWLRAEPTGLDYFVGCFTCAVILALLAWFFYRVAFGLCAAGGVASFIVVGLLGRATSGGAWVFGGVVGLAVGIYAFIYTRVVFIVLSSLSGAFMVVFAAASLIAGPAEDPKAAAGALLAQLWLVVMLSVISAALAGAGVYVQLKLSRSIRLALMPQDELPGRRRSRGGGRVGPRFTRV